MLISYIKKIIKKSKISIILVSIITNYLAKAGLICGIDFSRCGMTHSGMSTKESIDYINRVVADYLFYAGIPNNDIIGKKILEVGCGDNLGVALKLVSMGAQKVVSVDKFFSQRNHRQEVIIYRALRSSIPDTEKKRFDKALKIINDNAMKFNHEIIEYIYGKGIDCFDKRLFAMRPFDIVLSRAVLEHIYDIDTAFANMDDLLSNGGTQIHKIDFRDHNIFSSMNMHPLTFLTISKKIWNEMTKYSAGPNRKLVGHYRAIAEKYGYEYKILIAGIIGKDKELTPHKAVLKMGEDYNDSDLGLIRKIRPKLNEEFGNLADEELLISAIFFIAHKNTEKNRKNNEGIVYSPIFNRRG